MAQIIILEHHPMDCRIKIAQDQNHIQTLSERMGTGGGNVPMILEPKAYGFQKSINGIDAEEEKQPPLQADTHTKAYTLKIRGGRDTYTKWNGKTSKAGKGALIQIEKSATLAVSQDQVLFQPIDNS